MNRIIGFQIVDKAGNTPDEFHSFEVFVHIEDVLNELERLQDKRWLIEPIFAGDVEAPTFI